MQGSAPQSVPGSTADEISTDNSQSSLRVCDMTSLVLRQPLTRGHSKIESGLGRCRGDATLGQLVPARLAPRRSHDLSRDLPFLFAFSIYTSLLKLPTLFSYRLV